ncbi:MAG: hypothetical protein EBR15_01170 [Gammaproteobacteria bacterium]|nr:hypothetical protein [Gammaproteobacteria bacterium]
MLHTATPWSRAASRSMLLVPVAASAINFKEFEPAMISRVMRNLLSNTISHPAIASATSA